MSQLSEGMTRRMLGGTRCLRARAWWRSTTTACLRTSSPCCPSTASMATRTAWRRSFDRRWNRWASGLATTRSAISSGAGRAAGAATAASCSTRTWIPCSRRRKCGPWWTPTACGPTDRACWGPTTRPAWRRSSKRSARLTTPVWITHRSSSCSPSARTWGTSGRRPSTRRRLNLAPRSCSTPAGRWATW